MKFRSIMLLGAAFVILPNFAALAGSRYEAPPAAVLSSDLASPWLLQLQQAPSQRSTTRIRTYQSSQKPRLHKAKRRNFWGKPVAARPASRNTGIFANWPSRNKAHSNITNARRSTAVPAAALPTGANKPYDPKYLPQTVTYATKQAPGTIIIDTQSRFLYLVTGNSTARRYGVGVGKQGFEWAGTNKISRKAEWPSWTPPKVMIKREAAKGNILPAFMEGGPDNPLGARALYIGDTIYRIHGTNQPWTIGEAVSSGCIRMRNEDVMDLYERAQRGAKVIVS